RMIRETEPPKPSTRLRTLGEKLTEVARHRHTEPERLSRLVRGDLDWIAMKCLEKDRQRRYESANDVGADIRRHLQNEPIVARPPTTAYRLQKAIRRNKIAYAAVLALVLGTIAATWQAAVATRARIDAVRQRQAAQVSQKHAVAVMQYLITVFQSPDPARDG